MAATRPCRRCRTPRPPQDFPLWDHPEAKAFKWATRGWCAACLVERGHVTAARAREFRIDYLARDAQARTEARAAAEAARAQAETKAKMRALTAEVQAATPRVRVDAEWRAVRAEVARSDKLVAELLNMAHRDPAFDRALARAAAWRAKDRG